MNRALLLVFLVSADSAAGLDIERGPVPPLKWPLPKQELAADDLRCDSRLLRGWLRVTCKGLGGSPGAQVLGGSREGLYIDVDDDLRLTMPLVQGDRRVIQITTTQIEDYSYKGHGRSVRSYTRPAAIFSEVWVGTEGPQITILRAAE
jgi:hypothetical protein